MTSLTLSSNDMSFAQRERERETTTKQFKQVDLVTVLHIYINCSLINTIQITLHCIHAVLFSPRAICALLHLQTILPGVEFAQIQLCLKKDNLKHWNLPMQS